MKVCTRSAAPRSFTFIEIMITVVIVGVLAVIAIPSYQNFIEDGRARMCEGNLRGLKSAFDIYVAEHNVVPGDLGQIPSRDIEKALALARRGEGWQEKAVRFIDERREGAYAFAQLINELRQGNMKMFSCPSREARHTDSSAVIISYGINRDVARLTKEEYENLQVFEPVIADCDRAVFQETGEIAVRHKHIVGVRAIKYANVVTVGGWVEPDPAARGQEDPEWKQQRERTIGACNNAFSSACRQAIKDLKNKRKRFP